MSNPLLALLSMIFVVGFGAYLLKRARKEQVALSRLWHLIHGVWFVILGVLALAGIFLWLLIQFLKSMA